MSNALQIVSLRIRTRDGWQNPYDLDAPVIAIIGSIDTGKSSLLDCIAFAMGKDIEEFRGAVNIHLREVEIKIRVESGAYSLRRSRKTSSYVEVFDATGTLLGQFYIRQFEARKTISSWILEELRLDDSFGSVRLPGGKALDFAGALLPYCYLTQDNHDRYVVQPARQDVSRLITLKLLLNLTTPKYEQLSGIIRDADNEIDRKRRQAQLISEFLAESDSTNLDALANQIAVLKRAEAESAARLEKWRGDARAASSLNDLERNRITEARRAVGTAEAELDRLTRKHESAQLKLSSCEKALEALRALEERSPDDRTTLRLAFTSSCPICETDISARVPNPGCCNLCGEPLAGSDHPMERNRLESVYAEAKAEESKASTAVAAAGTPAQAARDALQGLLHEADTQAGDSVTPYVDAISHASSELSRIRGELTSLGRISESFDRLHARFTEIEELEGKQKVRRNQIAEIGQLESLESVIDALNMIFRKVVQGIDLPHSTGVARLDPESLMPLVDEQKFSQRGGGAKSAVSIAYSLTLLTYTLENALAKLPSLLIIDSPQKNLGSNRDDKALAHRVYERFLDNATSMKDTLSGQFYRPFQLIIVDNDIHPDIRARVAVHQFKRGDGFIRGLADPHGATTQGVQLALSED